MSRLLTVPLLALLFLAACGGSRPPGSAPPSDSDVVVQVINHSFHDLDVYAYLGAKGRILGFASGHRITVFRIPWRQVSGATRARLSGHPIGSGRRIASGYLALEPGSVVTWTVEPQLGSSSIAVQ